MAVRIAFIGAGGIANAHMRTLQHVPDAKLVGFADPDLPRAQQAAAQYGGAAYEDFRVMLDEVKPDAAYVCVPPHAHTGQEEDLAARAIPFFVEKPVANTLERARAIESAINNEGVIAAVGYHWRYMDFTEMAQAKLAGKTIGMALGYWMGGMPGVFWWRRMDLSAGQLVEQTTHIVDLARYLCGDIIEVYAAMATRALGAVDNFTVTDVGCLTVKFASGAVGAFHNTCLLNGFGYTVGLHLVTPSAVIELDGSQCHILEAGSEEIHRGGNDAMLAEDRAFVKAVRTSDASGIRSNYSDALRTLAVTLAANESAKTGQPVRL